MLHALLEYDADPDVADQFGITPLIHAAARGDFLSVKMLLEAGATPTKEDVEGKSAMDLARHFGDAKVLEVLEGAQEQSELLALKNLGIGTHRGTARSEGARPPISAR